MLILYHNRYSFSIDDSTGDYLDDFARYLQKPFAFWYLPSSKRRQINLIRNRMLYLMENNRQIYEQLLVRKDYSTFESKQQTILKIYQWLQTLPDEPATKSGIDINQWEQDLKSQFGHLLLESESSVPELQKVLKKLPPLNFHQILTGPDDTSRKQKFEHLIAILLKEQWIAPSETEGIYQFRNTGTGGRLQLAALYFTLNKLGHIQQRLTAPKVAAVFNSWLSHSIPRESFIKAFQTEQQDTFNCGAHKPRYKYVRDCSLLLREL
ncbi:hypothetical protein L0657_23445 [Dyadobacter sp. CY345]|uniref:hypothetical protein n=1 Tax=Dyadobacter sp. CY345 TaxID=2909335 RepID=UPI001F3D26EF|nr:hypothetical protein [Dyadobacter sp. CY345]MCF2446929.1 hypothetical protein [Dyadobacter sp. CY345]